MTLNPPSIKINIQFGDSPSLRSPNPLPGFVGSQGRTEPLISPRNIDNFGSDQTGGLFPRSEQSIEEVQKTNTNQNLGEKLGQAVQGLKGQTIRGNEPNCGYTVMEAYDKAGGKGFAKKMGLDPYVPTAYDTMKNNGKWQALKLTPGVTIPPGAVGFSEGIGHVVVAGADGKFYGANESGRKSLGKSWYQVESGNLDAVLVPKEIAV